MIRNIIFDIEPENLNNNELIKEKISKQLKIDINKINYIDYIKRSIDARHKSVKYNINANIYIDENFQESESIISKYKYCQEDKIVHIIGAGPAGYFAALELIEYAIKPIIFERGKNTRERRIDLKNLMQFGIVNNNSNYCFGEGGAGTYSDGKLYTRSNKRGDVKKILKILVEHGANPDILIDSHPHIGSNKLHKIISNIRETILKFGGEINFNSKLTDLILNNQKIEKIVINNNIEIKIEYLILATGHSARDIFDLLNKKNIFIESKPFTVGFRIEHPQELINEIQYGKNYNPNLPPANYRLVTQVKDKGVFSFCMCPGGVIVPSVTDSNELVVNGMSNSGRNLKYANSGIVVTVDSLDFKEFSLMKPFDGLNFQKKLEQIFFTNNNENPIKSPAQNLIDFLNKTSSNLELKSSYIPGLINKRIDKLFPQNLYFALKLGIEDFNKKMKGFITKEANVIGLESRTSSPIRITRDKLNFNHIQINNLFPAGEGAGYAGGIVSSAIDGQNAAKAILKRFGLDSI